MNWASSFLPPNLQIEFWEKGPGDYNHCLEVLPMAEIVLGGGGSPSALRYLGNSALVPPPVPELQIFFMAIHPVVMSCLFSGCFYLFLNLF